MDMTKPVNENIIIKTTSDRKYGLGKNGRAYKTVISPQKCKDGEYELATKWVQVHYASYERVAALELLKGGDKRI